MILIFLCLFFFQGPFVYASSNTGPDPKLREVYLEKKQDLSQKEQRVYDHLFEYGEKIDEQNCSDSRVLAQTGNSEHLSKTRRDGAFGFELWKQKDPQTYYDCYEMGEVFGAGGLKSVEEILAKKIMTEAAFKEWLRAREVSDLKDENELLKKQKASALRSARAAYDSL